MVRAPDPGKDTLKIPARMLHMVAAGTIVHRVHLRRYLPAGAAVVFNGSGKGWARFSPLRDAKGKVVAVLYAGTTYECALMETVFHDVPLGSDGYTFDRTKLEDQVHSRIEILEPLRLVDLTSVGLRLFKLRPRDVTETDAADYGVTQQWASALYEANPTVQGLYWTSRQDNRAQAMMLFEGRLAGVKSIRAVGTPEALVDALNMIEMGVVELAEKILVDLS